MHTNTFAVLCSVNFLELPAPLSPFKTHTHTHTQLVPKPGRTVEQGTNSQKSTPCIDFFLVSALGHWILGICVQEWETVRVNVLAEFREILPRTVCTIFYHIKATSIPYKEFRNILSPTPSLLLLTLPTLPLLYFSLSLPTNQTLEPKPWLFNTKPQVRTSILKCTTENWFRFEGTDPSSSGVGFRI